LLDDARRYIPPEYLHKVHIQHDMLGKRVYWHYSPYNRSTGDLKTWQIRAVGR
jgi:hypothetical protein